MKVLFVCLGNICRSPLAEGLMKDKLTMLGMEGTVSVDSAGFEPFHLNDSPDPRAIKVAQKHGIDISGHQARLFLSEDFDEYDKIYVMDSNNYRDVIRLARNDKDKKKVDYLMNCLRPGSNASVEDPWYGNDRDFEVTYHTLDQATMNLVKKIKDKHQ